MNELMALIDANSDKISEGDYIKMCNCMKDLHRSNEIKYISVMSGISEDPFVISIDAFCNCYNWILASSDLETAYDEWRSIPATEKDLKIASYESMKRVEEYQKECWRSFRHSTGFDDLMFFVKNTNHYRIFTSMYQMEDVD